MKKLEKKLDIEEFDLTPRQLEIAKLIAQGKPRKTMADILKISIHTIDTHISRLKVKIGTSTIYESVCFLSHYF